MPKATGESRISVALCTHNGAAWVLAQVDSILAQSRPVDELVVSDDASSDDSVAIIRRAVGEYTRAAGHTLKLTVLENPVALGVTRNFEQAVLATTGDLIALCDQDDVWHPDRIAITAGVFADPAVDLVFSDARLVDGDGSPLGGSLFTTLSMSRGERRHLRAGSAFEALLGRNLVTGATVVFRRRLLELASPFGSAWVHDEWLAALAAATGGVRMIEAELIDYRQHGGNQIGAARLTASAKVSRVTQPRAERNARLLERSRQLSERLGQLGDRVTPAVRAEAAAKVTHEELRSSLPASRVLRLPAVAGELLRGGYSRYGRGLLDAGRDLLQPAG